jgi:hypothetical protein
MLSRMEHFAFLEFRMDRFEPSANITAPAILLLLRLSLNSVQYTKPGDSARSCILPRRASRAFSFTPTNVKMECLIYQVRSSTSRFFNADIFVVRLQIRMLSLITHLSEPPRKHLLRWIHRYQATSKTLGGFSMTPDHQYRHSIPCCPTPSFIVKSRLGCQ